MPRLGNRNTEIQLVERSNSKVSEDEVVGTADKVEYGFIKEKGDPVPRAATVVMYGVKITAGEKLPAVFDILADEFNGVAYRHTKIVGVRVQNEVEGKTIAIATAPITAD